MQTEKYTDISISHKIMTRRLFAFLYFITTFTFAALAQTMTDQQVIEYTKQQMAAGVSQRNIATQLLRRGVTTEQIERIKKQIESENQSISKNNELTPNINQTRQRTTAIYNTANISHRDSIIDYNDFLFQRSIDTGQTNKVQIYGHDLFNNPSLTFEPSVNLATPPNYRLGPGDEVYIDIWGESENSIREIISPEGNIQVSGLGPIHLSGMTVNEANTYLKTQFSKIYSGINGENPTSQIQLTLGNTRTIQINVIGEVAVPGTYALSAFSSVFHALYSAGGVNNIGSLRNIKVMRNGKKIAEIDVYEILMQGKMTDDIRLQEGDIVMVDAYQELVQLEGKVRRPMFYEMKENETLQQLLNYAGGLTGEAYKKSIRIIRKNEEQHEIHTVNEMDFGTFKLNDNDVVSVESVLDRYDNKIEIRGAVYRPGIYQLDGTVNTVKALIKKADGLLDDAFTGRGLLDREKDDLSHEMISFNLQNIMNGTETDIILKKNDLLYIPSIADMKEEERITISGEVLNPGTFLYSAGMTVEDLIVMAGGLKEAAATTKIEVARRVKNPGSQVSTNELGKTYSIELADGLQKKGDAAFKLEPFDQVYVRRSPSYREQANVTLQGEVLFGGIYALQNKNERISTLIERAGGVTPDAYLKGARLTRTMTEDELKRRQDVMELNSSAGDSIKLTKEDLQTTYSVGIDLEEALKNKGGNADIVLREGDVIFIPEMNNTVKISGTVMYPNTVTYKKGAKISYYINQAGGFGNRAKKTKVYVVYANGNVAKAKRLSGAKIEPGCEIIVPSKPERNANSLTQTITIASSVTSMAAMIATLYNAFK